MRHSAANQNHILLLRRVTLTDILHCCEAHKGCSGTLHLQFQTAPQATAAFCRSAQFNYLIRLLRQNISRPKPPNIFIAFRSCLAAQDISRRRSRHIAFARKLCSLIAHIYPRKNIASGARAHFFAYRSLRPCAGHYSHSVCLIFSERALLRAFGQPLFDQQQKRVCAEQLF